MIRILAVSIVLSVGPLAAFAQDSIYSSEYGGGIASPSLDTAIAIGREAANQSVMTEIVSKSVHDKARASAFKSAYIVSPSTRSQAATAFISRLRGHSPAAAEGLQEQMHAHDFGQIYSGIVAPFGLRRGDIGDAVAAYTLLGWMIATGSTDPTRAQVVALRERIVAGLAANPKFADSATRAALGEEMVISFVTLHAGWQSARREGKVQEYSDGVAAMFRKQTGNDLRQLVLTDRGLEKRG